MEECEEWLSDVESKKKFLEEEEMLILEKELVLEDSVVEKEFIAETVSNPEQEPGLEESITEAKDTAAEERLTASTSSVLSLLRESRPKFKCEECREIFDRVSRLKGHLCDSNLSNRRASTEGSQKGDTGLEKAMEGLVITNEKGPVGTLTMSSVQLNKSKEEVRDASEVIECAEKADKQQVLYVEELKA